jgi:hypothetical protein
MGAHNIKPSIHALTTVLLKQLNTDKSRIKSALGKEPLDRSEGDIDFVSKWLYAHESSKVQDLFRSIPEATLRQTCREMRYLKVTGNSVVISEGSIMHIPFFAIVRFPYEISCLCRIIEMKKGETGNLAYIIISGTVSVWQRTPGSCHIFDEISVIEDGPDQNGGELQFFDPKKDAETVKRVRSDTYSRKYFICSTLNLNMR